MGKIEALENLKKLDSVWNGWIKELIEEENFSYLKVGRNAKNCVEKYRVSIFPRKTYQTNGFWEEGQAKAITPSRNEIIYKIEGYVDRGNFNLSFPRDGEEGVVKLLSGRLVRNSLNSNLSNLQDMANKIAEKYRDKYFGKDFLREILGETNNFIGFLKN